MFDTNHLHPMIIHFPIVLVFIGLLFDVLGIIFKKQGFERSGFILLLLGMAGALAAYFSGEFAGEGVSEAGALGSALEAHEAAAILALWILGATVVVRTALVVIKRYTGWLRVIPLVLFTVATLAVARTGYYGGELVYRHAAGVQFDTVFGSEVQSAPDDED